MIFDLNFKYSFEYIKQYKLIDKMYENIINKEEDSNKDTEIKKEVEEKE